MQKRTPGILIDPHGLCGAFSSIVLSASHSVVFPDVCLAFDPVLPWFFASATSLLPVLVSVLVAARLGNQTEISRSAFFRK